MTISQNCGPKSQQGFGLLELLVSIAIALLVIGAATRVFMQSMQSTAFVMQRNEMQTELRAAANQVIRDLQQAGTGVPIGGIPIPQQGVAGGSNPLFGADATLTYLSSNNTLTQGRLYKVTPARSASSVGPLRSPATSDAIVITYADPNLNWSTYSTTTLASDGSTLTMPSTTSPAVNDASVGITVGDTLLLHNSVGSAVGDVTAVNGTSRLISFANSDPLNLNQSTANVGSIKSLRSGSSYPAVTVSRIMMITYFLKQGGNDCADFCLMRQVGAHTPVPVAEHIVDLQLTYDVFDDTTGALTANLPDAATGSPATPKPNQIRKINLTITARSPRPWPGNMKQPGCSTNAATACWDYITYTTSIGPRNLSFHDRYN